MAKNSISIKKRNNKKKNSRSIKNLKKIGDNSVGGLRRSITSRRRQNKRKTKKGGARPALELSYGYEGEVDLKVSGTFSEGNVEDKPTSLIFSKGTREDPRPRVGLPGYHWGNFSSTPIIHMFRSRICKSDLMIETPKRKIRFRPDPSPAPQLTEGGAEVNTNYILKFLGLVCDKKGCWAEGGFPDK